MGKVVHLNWLDFDKATMSGKIISMPSRDQIHENIQGTAHRRVVF